MELRHLRYVVAVADAGTFTGAARSCHVAQSALSKQVAQLERELGTPLFDRGSRSASLTDAGRILVSTARRVLADTAAAVVQINDLAGRLNGCLRIGATQTATEALDFAAVLGVFRRAHPQVRVTVTAGPTGEIVEAVATGALDLALAGEITEVPDRAVQFHALRDRDPLVAVVPPTSPLAVRGSISLAELADYGPFVEFRPGTRLRDRLDEAFRFVGRSRRITFELGQIHEMVQFAKHGLGTAIVPSVFTRSLTDQQGVVLTIHDPALFVTVGAYSRLHDQSPAVSAALDLFAREALQHNDSP